MVSEGDEKEAARGKGDGGVSFCEIAAHRVAAKIVFEDAISVAFLDHRPLFPGHVLLIPKEHYRTLTDLPSELVGPFFGMRSI